MARGNDAANALAELAEKFGKGVGVAQDLIDANAARFDARLRAASQKAVDLLATSRLDLDELAKQVDTKDTILDACVHGDGDVVYVAENPDGRAYKAVVSLADLGPEPEDKTRRPSRAKAVEAEPEAKPEKPKAAKAEKE